MNLSSHIPADLPRLSDEGAGKTLDFLYQLIEAFENHYHEELLRYHQLIEPPDPQPGLFDDFDDELPPF